MVTTYFSLASFLQGSQLVLLSTHGNCRIAHRLCVLEQRINTKQNRKVWGFKNRSAVLLICTYKASPALVTKNLSQHFNIVFRAAIFGWNNDCLNNAELSSMGMSCCLWRRSYSILATSPKVRHFRCKQPKWVSLAQCLSSLLGDRMRSLDFQTKLSVEWLRWFSYPEEVFRTNPTRRRPRGGPRTHWRDWIWPLESQSGPGHICFLSDWKSICNIPRSSRRMWPGRRMSFLKRQYA